jgi:hypothetical protein
MNRSRGRGHGRGRGARGGPFAKNLINSLKFYLYKIFINMKLY